MVRRLTPRYPHMVANNMLTNCKPLSVSNLFGISKGMIPRSKKMSATCVALLLAFGTDHVNLEYLLVT